MKIDSVSRKYLKASLLTTIVTLALSFLIIGYIIYGISKKYGVLSQKDLSTSIYTLQRDIAERVSLLVSSQLFVDYLHSGEVTRDKSRLDLNLLVSSIVEDEIVGLTVYNSELEQIYNFGESTKVFAKTKLCYLDNLLNYEFGHCFGSLVVYFSAKKFTQKLQMMNPRIEYCQNCRISFFGGKSQFGSLVLSETSHTFLHIKQAIPMTNFFTLFVFLSLVLVGMVFIILHRSLRKVSQEYIYGPIKSIVSNLDAGKSIDINQINVQELKYVASVFNNYIESLKERESLKSNAKLGELATKVAHDIRSPVSVLEVILENNTTIPETERTMLQMAAKRINEIANDLLSTKRKNSELTIVSDAVEQVLSEKKLENSKFNDVTFLVSSIANVSVPIKIRETTFKSILSNIINNSIEACRVINKPCNINLSLQETSEEIVLKIKDNGPGFSESALSNLFVSEYSFGKQQGNGVGLYSARRALSEVGGSITAENDNGALITIQIPKINGLK